MMLNDFYLAIKSALIDFPFNDDNSQAKKFGESLDSIMVSNTAETIKMTNLTIWFESFYESLTTNAELKEKLLAIRIQRWQNHFGTPTLSFLISYRHEINNNLSFLNSESLQVVTSSVPLNTDTVNNIVVHQNALAGVEMPQRYEENLVWLKTYNPTGGYTLPPSDPYSQQFIIDAGKTSDPVLEIGAAFGTATLEALKLGASVHCNDSEALNLAVVQRRYAAQQQQQFDSVTGDSDKLTLLPGTFPEELAGLKTTSYQAILACRVLHFLTGPKVDAAIKEMANLLKLNGKMYIICETPFQKNWSRFLPQYEKNVADKVEWPGEISDSSRFETSERRGAALPRFIHNVTQEVLQRSAERAGNLEVEQCTYISRAGQFTKDAILDGRESVGMIARRIR